MQEICDTNNNCNYIDSIALMALQTVKIISKVTDVKIFILVVAHSFKNAELIVHIHLSLLWCIP